MWARIRNLIASPRDVLRKIVSLDDSPHAIALGVAIGTFVGMTPTVGLQTICVLIILACTRRLFYFNGVAAIAATYISNPITMVPLYYFWYLLGAVFIGGNATSDQFEALINVSGFSEWWDAMCTIGVEVGAPMFLGAFITAPIATAIAYPSCYALLVWIRKKPDRRDDAGSPSVDADSTAAGDSPAEAVDNLSEEEPGETEFSRSQSLVV